MKTVQAIKGEYGGITILKQMYLDGVIDSVMDKWIGQDPSLTRDGELFRKAIQEIELRKLRVIKRGDIFIFSNSNSYYGWDSNCSIKFE